MPNAQGSKIQATQELPQIAVILVSPAILQCGLHRHAYNDCMLLQPSVQPDESHCIFLKQWKSFTTVVTVVKSYFTTKSQIYLLSTYRTIHCFMLHISVCGSENSIIQIYMCSNVQAEITSTIEIFCKPSQKLQYLMTNQVRV